MKTKLEVQAIQLTKALVRLEEAKKFLPQARSLLEKVKSFLP